MKILWLSNAPWSATGYGNQTDMFVWRLRDLGHEITCSNFYGLQGAPQKLDGMLMLPAGRDAFGQDVIAADAEHVGADIVITLVDAWVLSPEITRRFNWVAWAPIDHDPIPPAVARSLEAAFQPIAYSRFGEARMREAGLDPLYVPHGVDTDIFYPVDKRTAREAIGIPPEYQDRFLVGIVAANKGTPSRKAFDQQIRAFARFHANHPRAMLYLHTDVTGINGVSIHDIIRLAGLPEEAIATVPPYRYARGMIGKDEMAHRYSALDVLLNATKGEGFGLPIVEAMACGVPVIVTDFTAMPELVSEGAGWKVPVDGDCLTFSQESYQATPPVSGIHAALERAYLEAGGMREQARRGALAYDADVVTEQYWKPALEKIEKKLKRGEASSRGKKDGVHRLHRLHEIQSVPSVKSVDSPGCKP